MSRRCGGPSRRDLSPSSWTAVLAVTDTLPDLFPHVFPGHTEDAGLDLPPLTAQVEAQIGELLTSGRFDAWSEALARVGNCSKPVRLHGHSHRVDTGTGEIVSSYSSSSEPLGVTHGRRDTGRRCHPTPRNGALCCRHGSPTGCHTAHAEDDPGLGQPLCGDCYDHASQVVWQWWAPDLWRRFTIALRRLVAKTLGVPASRLGEHATVQYAKVAVYQFRGVVHFHALVRLDGLKTADGFAPVPDRIDARLLANLVQQAAASVRLTVPGVDDHDPTRVLTFGRQLDARPVRNSRRTDDPDRALTPEQVAGYLAKYATKSATDTGATNNPHHQRLRATARRLAARAKTSDQTSGDEDGPYELLGKWVHMLGFRGHFATKSRRYSITLGALRRARRRAQALIAEHKTTGRPLDLAALEADLLADDEDETTLVIGHWSYAGTGWATEAETHRGHRGRRPRPRVRPVEGRTKQVPHTAAIGRRGMVMSQIEDRLWSVQDVSDYLGVPVHTIYSWRSAGTGPPGRRVGKRLRYRPQDVRDWFESLPTGVVA